MTPVALALIPIMRALISAAPAAQEAWRVLEPALRGERDPTAQEWALLNRLADAHHEAVQTQRAATPRPAVDNDDGPD